MTGKRWESPRAREVRERTARHLAFEALMLMVDVGQLDRTTALSLASTGPMLIGEIPPNVYTENIVSRAEAQVDRQQDGDV